MAYDEFNPVAAFAGDVGGYESTSFVAFRDADFHSDDFSFNNRGLARIKRTPKDVPRLDGRQFFKLWWNVKQVW